MLFPFLPQKGSLILNRPKCVCLAGKQTQIGSFPAKVSARFVPQKIEPRLQRLKTALASTERKLTMQKHLFSLGDKTDRLKESNQPREDSNLHHCCVLSLATWASCKSERAAPQLLGFSCETKILLGLVFLDDGLTPF